MQRSKFAGAHRVKISAEVRGRLHEKLKLLEVSRNTLSRYLGVEWTTLRKWADGRTESCLAAHYERLCIFLSGEYDDGLLKAEEIWSQEKFRQNVSGRLEYFLSRLMSDFIVGQNRASSGEYFGYLERALEEAAGRLSRESGSKLAPEEQEEEERSPE